ncbi:MAG: hypothetical protein HYV19_01115 [Gemmatimonadetes bacterium]|nr:hypothetical protein [Gemmatimonadota bacterium]
MTASMWPSNSQAAPTSDAEWGVALVREAAAVLLGNPAGFAALGSARDAGVGDHLMGARTPATTCTHRENAMPPSSTTGISPRHP